MRSFSWSQCNSKTRFVSIPRNVGSAIFNRRFPRVAFFYGVQRYNVTTPNSRHYKSIIKIMSEISRINATTCHIVVERSIESGFPTDEILLRANYRNV